MTEFSSLAKPSFRIWNDCDYPVFYTGKHGNIVYANNHALRLFAQLGFPAIKNICQIPVFNSLFQSGLFIQEQEFDWKVDNTEMKFTIIPDTVTGYIGFYAESKLPLKHN
jgi:hypothetical protein